MSYLFFKINVSWIEDQVTDNFPSKHTKSSISSQTTKYYYVNDTMSRRPLGKLFMLKCIVYHKTFQQTEREVGFMENNRSKKCIL